MAKIDQYNLKASSEFPLSGTAEITQSLALTPSATSTAGIVTGTITSGGVPVVGATVKIFDVSNNPLFHDVTNPEGKYTIPEVVAGSYVITATKQGYLTPNVIPLSVIANRPTTVNITLFANTDATLNTLYGKIKQAVVLTPIAGATVNIFRVVAGVQTIVSTTTTNSSGQYLAPSLSAGDYIAIANKPGYYQNESTTVTLTTSDVESLDLALTVNQSTNTGTVSGIITDLVTGLPISSSTVALYNVVGTTETISQMTKTNSGGRYLFGDVASGNHIVKAFAQTNAAV